jgi:Flp pilus assembly protein TadG
VTAETAVVLPAMVVLTAGFLAVVVAVSAQLSCADAAHEGARVAARGQPGDVAVVADAVHRVAPGAQVTLGHSAGFVQVQVSQVLALPGGLHLTVRARAEALDETALGP